MVAHADAGPAIDTLRGVKAYADVAVLVFKSDVCRFNGTNANTSVATDAFFFIHVYIEMFLRTHMDCLTCENHSRYLAGKSPPRPRCIARSACGL